MLTPLQCVMAASDVSIKHLPDELVVFTFSSSVLPVPLD